MRVLPPKYVSRAQQWVVTFFTTDPKAKTVKEKQSQQWFSTQQEAKQFYDQKRQENQ